MEKLSEKLSAKLQKRIAQDTPDSTVSIHVMLCPGLKPSEVKSATKQIRRLAEDNIEELSLMSMVACNSKLSQLPDIAKIDEVQWIDADSEAPTEELID